MVYVYNPATNGRSAISLALLIARAKCLWCLAHTPLLSLPIILPRSEIYFESVATSENTGSFLALQNSQFRGTLIILFFTCAFLIIRKECLQQHRTFQLLLVPQRPVPQPLGLVVLFGSPDQSGTF